MATFVRHKDQLVVCPFNSGHKIAVRNRIKHIIECEKKIVSNFSVCIYNAGHRMARHEFAQHIQSCPDGYQYTREVFSRTKRPEVEEVVEVKSCEPSSSGALADDQTRGGLQPQPVVAVDSSSEDEWSKEKGPSFDIYGVWADELEDYTATDRDKGPQKLTKNQKKRNRKRAAKESQTKSSDKPSMT